MYQKNKNHFWVILPADFKTVFQNFAAFAVKYKKMFILINSKNFRQKNTQWIEIEIDPDEGKLKISSGNNSVQKISQTVVMNRKVQHQECQVHVVPRKK